MINSESGSLLTLNVNTFTFCYVCTYVQKFAVVDTQPYRRTYSFYIHQNVFALRQIG